MERRHYDEMRATDGEVRAHFRALADWLAETPAERVAEKRREADLLFHRVGITFAVYGDDAGAERLIPFDTIPRVIPKAEWNELAKGLRQRVAALNRFLHDIYHGQEILKAGVIPAEQVLANDAYRVSMLGLELPNRVYSHVAGIDLVRHEDGRYYVLAELDPKATSVSTPLREVLRLRRGVCQDFAHLMIACLRALGLAARYVSGYLITAPPPGRPRLVGADASHAWVSVWSAHAGWVDIDPTNDCLVDDEHITLAWGRDFSDVTPMRGVILGGGEQELEVRVTVTPVQEMAESVRVRMQ